MGVLTISKNKLNNYDQSIKKIFITQRNEVN